jgi:hypothetical protein
MNSLFSISIARVPVTAETKIGQRTKLKPWLSSQNLLRTQVSNYPQLSVPYSPPFHSTLLALVQRLTLRWFKRTIWAWFGGAILSSASGRNPVMSMLEGQVGANMVMQRVQQEQKHLYYREQALRYRDGPPADDVGSAGGLLRRHNQQVREGTDPEVEARGGTSGGRRDEREEPNAGTVVVE